MIRAGLFNFSKGEIGPELYGRIDVPAYSAGVKQARNVTILKYGGLQRRMGQRLAYELREPEDGWDADSSQARLVPFEYSIEQSYILLMRQAQMNPLAFGGAVLEEELAVANAVSVGGGRTQITIPFHEFEVGDEVWITGVEGAMGEFLNERVWIVTSVQDAANFRIDADTAGIAAFTGADGGITRVAAPPPPPPPPPVPPPSPPPVIPPVGGPSGAGGFRGRDPYLQTEIP